VSSVKIPASKPSRLEIIGLSDVPFIKPGDDLTGIILNALKLNDLELVSGDIIVIAQKIISKAEDRCFNLNDVIPGPEAIELAEEVDKDPRLVELILSETRFIARTRPGLIIVESKTGLVHANAGIDQSNIEQSDTAPRALLLPIDADRSAETIRLAIKKLSQADVGVIINDSMGRAWRRGTVGHTIGCAGVVAVSDQIGDLDLNSRVLQGTEVALADEIAAAASFVMGQANEGRPVALVRGAGHMVGGSDGFKTLLREDNTDLFKDW
jgi:coenzyme F420-0:L-glutamate ligase/coenzyme F420-1:gamma-L-glutamate ligase